MPDAEADDAAQERAAFRHLQDMIEWRFGLEDEEMKRMPDLIINGLKETLAYRLISTWVELRCAEIVLDGTAAEFGVEDALRPQYRERLDATRSKLESADEQIEYLRMSVVLREPLEEELAETKRWISEIS